MHKSIEGNKVFWIENVAHIKNPFTEREREREREGGRERERLGVDS